MTITRTLHPVYWEDHFSSDTRANYSTYGTVLWDSANQAVQIGATDGSDIAKLEIPAASVSQHLLSVSGRFYVGAVSKSIQYLDFYWITPTGDRYYRASVNDSTTYPNQVKLYYYNGSSVSNPLVSTNQVLNRDTWYKFKFGQYYGIVYYKQWPEGTPEPQTWIIGGYYCGESVGYNGSLRITSNYFDVKIDDLIVYPHFKVSCSGLPTGYQFRITGMNSVTAVATESGGTATAFGQHTEFPVTKVEVLNASGAVVDSLNTTDVWGGDEFQYAPAAPVQGNLTADATLSKTLSGNAFTANSILLAPNRIGGFSSQAILKQAVGGSFGSQAVARKNVQSSASADTALAKSGITGGVTCDTVVLKPVTGVFKADAQFVSKPEASFAGNAALKKTEAVTYTAVSVLKKTVSGSFAADAMVKYYTTWEYSFLVGCILTRKNIISGVAVYVVAKKTPIQTVSADARLLKQTIQPYTNNARLLKIYTATMTASSVLAKRNTGSFTVSAALTRTPSASFNVYSVFKREYSAAFNPRAVMLERNIPGSLTASAVFYKKIQGSFSVNAGLPARYTSSYSVNAYLTKTVISSITLKTVLFKVVVCGFSADAHLWGLDRYLMNFTLKVERSFNINVTVTKQASYTLNVVKQATYDVNVGFS